MRTSSSSSQVDTSTIGNNTNKSNEQTDVTDPSLAGLAESILTKCDLSFLPPPRSLPPPLLLPSTQRPSPSVPPAHCLSLLLPSQARKEGKRNNNTRHTHPTPHPLTRKTTRLPPSQHYVSTPQLLSSTALSPTTLPLPYSSSSPPSSPPPSSCAMTFSTFSRISAFSGELDAPDASRFSKPCFISCVDEEGGKD